MPLQSQLFRGDPKLEAAAVSDAGHIMRGASGPHVGKLQHALNVLDGANLQVDQRYGPATAAAVLAYKRKREIINRRYQTAPDDIVGIMTMDRLDREMLKKEKGEPPNPQPIPPLPPVPPIPPPAPVSVSFGIRCEAEADGEETQSLRPPEFFQIIDLSNKRAALYRFNFPGSFGLEAAFRAASFRRLNTNQFFALESINFPARYTTIITLPEEGRETLSSFIEIKFAPASAFPTRIPMGVHASLSLQVTTRPSTSQISHSGQLAFLRTIPFPSGRI